MAKQKQLDKAEAIRQAALAMIVEEGFHGLSMPRLAARAGIAPGTIYLYFQNRQDLLDTLYLEVRQQGDAAMLAGFDATMPLATGLRVLWHNTFHYFVAHPLEFAFTEQFINSPHFAAVAARENPEFREQRRAFYRHARERGELRELPVEVYWAVAFAPLYQLIRFALNGSLHLPADFQDMEQKLNQALEVVVAALQAP
ncbi:TetR/AcrR family transcriptional regulator [Hymenobacter chitinivorans]|uniref:AcrR family transcriptional regulator n=1 Tax=Hymenobacter chitinivorans DSM 11115 TaxID=1121954 RepID=A0A2M9B5F7_9BACT|nr:TetR/AcrR family transcriptional regulator [Hymenobacter chitinivorans]PJJ53171.1 AcrR family transcriptional regulator [Hymenobacter chitinivorans DSM 11115]